MSETTPTVTPDAHTTKFAYEGNSVHVYKFNEKTSSNVLAPQVYSLQKSMFGYYLNISRDKFEVPETVYGDMITRVKKVMHTYSDRLTNTGVLFTGDKGSGKTMLTNIICNHAINELNLPVILIGFAASGPGFTDFIESLGECVLLFDEFGKMYNNSDSNQDDLLSLLDGSALHKRLIMMTENNESEISTFLKGRPGRVFYHFRYGKLTPEVITEVCQQRGINEKMIASIIDVSRAARVFSFDILNAILEELERYGQPIQDTIADLNLGINDSLEIRMEVLKVVHAATGEELKIPLVSKFVNKPQLHDDTTITSSTHAERLAQIKSEYADKFDEFRHDRNLFHISEDDLKMEENDVCVYTNNSGDYIVTLKYAPEDLSKYATYLG